MGLFGSSFRPGNRGIFAQSGMGGFGLVETREQKAERERLEAEMGLGGATASDTPTQDTPSSMLQPESKWDSIGNGLTDAGRSFMAAQAAFDGDYSTSATLSQSVGAARKAAQAAAMKRQQDREDYLWQQQNKSPTNNDTQRDYDYIKSILGEKAAGDFLRGKADPIVSIPLPGGQVYTGPRSGIPGGAPAPLPTEPVGKMTIIPDDPAVTLPSGKSWSALDQLEPSPEEVRQNYIGVMGRVAGERQFQEWLRENRRRGGR